MMGRVPTTRIGSVFEGGLKKKCKPCPDSQVERTESFQKKRIQVFTTACSLPEAITRLISGRSSRKTFFSLDSSEQRAHFEISLGRSGRGFRELCEVQVSDSCMISKCALCSKLSNEMNFSRIGPKSAELLPLGASTL